MNALKGWMQLATPHEKVRMAKLADTTVGTLQQIAGGYRTDGEAHTTPELARAIEEACRKFPSLPQIKRTQLCPACAKCELARAACKH